MCPPGSVAAAVCFGSIGVHAGRILLPAFIGPRVATPTHGHHTARRSCEGTVLEVGDKTAGEVRVSKSGLSPDLQWITDPWDRGVLFSVKVDEVVHDVRSKFQHVQASAVTDM